MSLKAALLAKRGSSIYCMERHYGHEPVAMIRLCPWQETEWMLRWSGLNSLSLAREEGRERLELHFARHHVTVIGFCLHEMLEDIQAFQLGCMRSFPASYRTTFPATEAFIEQLLVQPKTEPAASPPVR
ncbi:hypothetical protein OH491_12095 [Termitidicoccus mucosus]|uniref:hypothetical protein n=2 Tax=Termitidicoccus mucosus TaxID=1184151 RepID=UPI003182DF7D